MPSIGQRSRFAFVIGPPAPEGKSADHREVDIYAAGRWVTSDDSVAYVPQFVDGLRHTLAHLLRRGAEGGFVLPRAEMSVADNHRRLLGGPETEDARLAHAFMNNWGPTTDNVLAHLFLRDGMALVSFSFWRPTHHDPRELGEVFVAELPERELLWVLHEAAWTLALGLG